MRKGDGDFDYVSIGDLNRNNLIDAFDISAVGIKLETGVSSRKVDPIAGKVTVIPSKKTYNAGEEVQFIVKGEGLKSVNALSFYDAEGSLIGTLDSSGFTDKRTPSSVSVTGVSLNKTTLELELSNTCSGSPTIGESKTVLENVV